MNEYDTKKYILLLLRFQLLNFSSQELMALYSDNGSYKDFLYGLLYKMQVDTNFFMLPTEVINKVLDITNQSRFLFCDEESRGLGNQIIENCNAINGLSDEKKQQAMKDYLQQQMYYRDYVAKEKYTISFEEFLGLLSFDYVTYDCLTNKNYQDLYQNRAFLSSTNQFLETWPELYQNNPKFLQVSEEIIQDSLHSKNPNQDRKQYKKMAIQTLQNIKERS